MNKALMLHVSDAEWTKSVQELLVNTDPPSEQTLSQLIFHVLPVKWPLIARNLEVKQNLVKFVGLPSLDPCLMLLIALERVPAIPSVLIFRDSFKELIFELINSMVLSKERVSTIISHCANFSEKAMHPQPKAVIKSLFRLQEILTNYLSYCPKTLADPVYFAGIYRAFLQESVLDPDLFSIILQVSVLYNKLPYLFTELTETWGKTLKEKLVRTLVSTSTKRLSEVNFDTVILKFFEYFHENKSLKHEVALEILYILCPNKLDLLTIRKLAESKHFGIREGRLVINFLLKTTSPDLAQALFTIFAETWGDQGLSLIAPYIQHQCILSFITLLIDLTYVVKELMAQGWCNMENAKHLESLRKGIEQRLESTDFRPFATCVWSLLCDLLGINKEEIGLEVIPESDLFKEEEEEEVETKQVIKVEEKKEENKTGTRLEYDENDSDNESDFEPYNTTDTYEDITKIKPPKFIYDCILGLDSENPQRYQFSLEYCESLIRTQPLDLDMYSKELTLKLLRADNRFNFDLFYQWVSKALAALLVKTTVTSLKETIERFYSNEASMGSKMQILDAINLAVTEMSTLKKVEEVPKEDTIMHSNKTLIKAPKRLAQLKADKKGPQTSEFIKYAGHFYYGLLSRISDRSVNLQLFSEAAEPLLTKLVSTLAHILRAACIALCVFIIIGNSPYIMQMIGDAFPLLTILSNIKNQDLKLQALYLAMVVADSAKPELIEEDIATGLERLHDWLVDITKDEPVEKCKEVAAVSASIIRDKVKQFTHDVSNNKVVSR